LTDRAGRAFLLAGPSGHGKSSLSLELVRRGHGFLSDDIAPLDLRRGTIEPFQRTVALIDEDGSPAPEPFRSAARDPQGVRWYGKTLLDVGETLNESALVSTPAPLSHVLLLVAGDASEARTEVELVVRVDDAPELQSLFEQTEGVEILDRRADETICSWRLALDHRRRPTEHLTHVFESDRVVLFEKRWDTRPDFNAPPEARPVGRREAAEMLAKEMLNRRGAGRLLARYDGSMARIFVDLAGALSGARCFKLRVGACRDTADLIQGLVDGADGARDAS